MTLKLAFATALCLVATSVGFAAELSWSDKLALNNACGNDLKTLCGKVERGEGRMLQCIADNQSKLSPECATTIEALRSKLGLPIEKPMTPL